MAARRVLSLLAAKIPQNPIPKEISREFHPSPDSFSRSYAKYTRGFSSSSVENPLGPEGSTSGPESSSANQISTTSHEDSDSNMQHRVNSNLKISARHDLVMMFTCTVCDTRSMKTACRESYDKGVVVVRCDGCNNLHLIADRLGWFGKPGSVEEFLAARGEDVKKGSVDTLNLTLEDLAGKKNIDI